MAKETWEASRAEFAQELAKRDAELAEAQRGLEQSRAEASNAAVESAQAEVLSLSLQLQQLNRWLRFPCHFRVFLISTI